MAAETKHILIYRPDGGSEKEIGSFAYHRDAEEAMREHYEGLHESGERMGRLTATGHVAAGVNYEASGKGRYRIEERTVNV